MTSCARSRACSFIRSLPTWDLTARWPPPPVLADHVPAHAGLHGDHAHAVRNHVMEIPGDLQLPATRVSAMLDEVGLAGVARKRVGGFSLGMKQRLGIAAALLGDPGVLIFDERNGAHRRLPDRRSRSGPPAASTTWQETAHDIRAPESPAT